MIVRPTVVVDDRDQDALMRELDIRGPGYVPEWRPANNDPGYAVQLIASRFLQAVITRLAQSPDKNKLAFLDMLGQQLSPAQAARAPVVFELAKDVSSATAPAGTAVAAPPPPGSSQQVVFETESDVGLTAGKLVEVFSLWPGRDEYINHSADFLTGKQIELFDRSALTNTPHEIYISHPVLLNLSGNVVLELEFQLLEPAHDDLEIAWEYWDGQVWRGFALQSDCPQLGTISDDATKGLTGSGIIKLKADCAKSDKTTVNGLQAYWIRGRLTQSLPPDPARPLPEIESLRISSLVSVPMRASLSGAPIPVTTQATASLELIIPRNFSLFLAPGSESVAAAIVAAGPPQIGFKGIVVNESDEPLANAKVVIKDPHDSTFGQKPVAATLKDGKFEIALDSLGSKNELQFEVTFLNVTAVTNVKLSPSNPSVKLTLKLTGLSLTKAFNDGTKLDTTKPFYPFGQQPQPGTVFYFNNKEIFAKPGARFRMYLPRTDAPSNKLKTLKANGDNIEGLFDLNKLVVWEYWNGREWTQLINFSAETVKSDFDTSEILDFRVPTDLEPVDVNQDVDLWMRARLAGGGFGFSQTLSFKTGGQPPDNQFTVVVSQPPVLAAAVMGYTWQFGPFHPEYVLTFNDFRYEDHTYEAIWPGSSFLPYQRVSDATPAVYLGFDQRPPTADIGIFFNIVEQPAGTAIEHFTWEYWDGFAWSHLSVVDETAHLTSPGILSFIAEADSAAIARFGTALYFIRGRLKEDGPPPEVGVNAIYPNAVWALQQRTLTDVNLGKATGQPSEIFHVTQIPIIPGERLEVLELSGPRANVEWRLIVLEISKGDHEAVRKLEALLAKEILTGDIIQGDVRLRRDKQRRVTEVWVHWYPQSNLFFSGPNDRHYAIDRSRGLVFFGDGVNGRTLPQDATVNLSIFKSGGGADGNVGAKAISQLLGAISGVQAVFNARPAEGGADRETLEAFRLRAPSSVRHRGRALTGGDYEAMVREASAAVAVVKAIPNRNPIGRTLPGWLTIFIIPESKEPRPYPTRGLRDDVLTYLAERAPAGLAAGGRIYVTGPTYYPIDIAATLVPVIDSQAGTVETRARAALSDFLHPLHGGPAGQGWDFGRGLYLSDIATVLESVPGLKHAESIQLLVNNEVRGDFAPVPVDRILVAGSITLKLKGAQS